MKLPGSNIADIPVPSDLLPSHYSQSSSGYTVLKPFLQEQGRVPDKEGQAVVAVVVSAAEGHAVVALTVTTLTTLRNDENFDKFWKKVKKMAEEQSVHEAVLPRNRKQPCRYEEGQAQAHVHSIIQSLYHQIYYEALDLIVRSIRMI